MTPLWPAAISKGRSACRAAGSAVCGADAPRCVAVGAGGDDLAAAALAVGVRSGGVAAEGALSSAHASLRDAAEQVALQREVGEQGGGDADQREEGDSPLEGVDVVGHVVACEHEGEDGREGDGRPREWEPAGVAPSQVGEQPVGEPDREQHEREAGEEGIACLALERRAHLLLGPLARGLRRRCGGRLGGAGSVELASGRGVFQCRGAVGALEPFRGFVRLERGAVGLAAHLEVLQRLLASALCPEQALRGGLFAHDRGILAEGLRRHAYVVADDVVDACVRPDAAEKQKYRQHDRQQLLGSRRLQLLYIRSPIHLRPPPLIVLGRNSTISSQSSASAMRSNVSIRGGRPPRSKRAIADWVVPHSTPSSCCERSRTRLCSTTCSAIWAKNHPCSGSPATRSRSWASRRCKAVSFLRVITSVL